MAHDDTISLDECVNLLRAAGETTRLRLLALLAQADLTVSDLTDILGQSQPRISRHLKLLVAAGFARRYQEGAWAYFRAVDRGAAQAILSLVLDHISADDNLLRQDAERLEVVKTKRAEQAASYFAENASSWDRIRSLHVSEDKVEEAMLRIVGSKTVQTMLDLGTGTGRLLELFAPVYTRAIGIDASHEMLSIARANIEKADLSNVQIRHGDAYRMPVPRESCELVTIHQVLHFLDDPASAIAEAAKTLVPGGRLLIVDFAPHLLEFLRDDEAHLRLGFSHEQMADWLNDCDLEIEEVVDLEPVDDKENQLTVTIWMARDKRRLVA